jgi:predicted GIY-YIG superfamily endonuclease
LTRQSIPLCYPDARLLLSSRLQEEQHALLRRDQRPAAPHLGARARHREGRIDGFTKRYSIKRLVWYEEFPWMIDAIKREKAIKHWPRAWKIALIEKENPDWRDLSSHLLMF